MERASEPFCAPTLPNRLVPPEAGGEGARCDDPPVAPQEQRVPGITFARAAEMVRRPGGQAGR